MTRLILGILIGVAGVAIAQPPEIPASVWMSDQQWAGFDAACRLPDGTVQTCAVTIDLRRQCWPDPATRPDCERADTDGNGAVGLTDLSVVYRFYGQTCSEVGVSGDE